MTRPCPITADRDEWRGAVTQADRDAAAELLGFKDWEDAMDYRNPGRIIDGVNRTAQAFARHRLATQADALAVMREAEGALEEANRQLSYMDERSPSGTTPAVIARNTTTLANLANLRAAIARAGGV